MFSTPQIPKPAPLPRSPIEDEYRLREQEQAQRRAAVDLAASGRRTTEFAGRSIALAEQKERVKKRASTDALGL